jgi:hypothetical protein
MYDLLGLEVSQRPCPLSDEWDLGVYIFQNGPFISDKHKTDKYTYLEIITSAKKWGNRHTTDASPKNLFDSFQPNVIYKNPVLPLNLQEWSHEVDGIQFEADKNCIRLLAILNEENNELMLGLYDDTRGQRENISSLATTLSNTASGGHYSGLCEQVLFISTNHHWRKDNKPSDCGLLTGGQSKIIWDATSILNFNHRSPV